MSKPTDLEKLAAYAAAFVITVWIVWMLAIGLGKPTPTIDPDLRVPGVVVVDDAEGMQRAVREAVERRRR